MSGREYWRRRAKEWEQEWTERCKEELESELRKYYRDALRAIEEDIAALYGRYAKENGLSYAEATRLIRGAEYATWRLSLREYVAQAAVDTAILRELNTLAMRSRITRLEKLYTETAKELQALGERSELLVKEFLMTAYKERYYHGIYELARVGKLAIPVSKVEPERMERVMALRWEGGNYSTRIWKNTAKLSKVIKRTIAEGLHRGLGVEKMARSVEGEMKAGYKNAERLVRTEMNFVQTRSAAETMEAAGLSEYEFVAVLDHRTTPRCQSLDGSVHLLEEMQQGANAPPMHPRCRSTISAIVEGGTRTARVGRNNIRVPGDMKYSDYKAIYIDKTATLKDWQEKVGRLANSAAVSKQALERIINSVSGAVNQGSAGVNRARNARILAALQAAMAEYRLKGELVYPPPKMDLAEYTFDAEHTQGDKHPHDVTEAEARRFISEAYFTIIKYGGKSYNYYGKDGAAFVRTDFKTIRTAFKASEYKSRIQRLIEVYENELD